MKKLLVCLLALSACDKPSQEYRNSTNDNFQVELLFEVDGVRVYRFEDGGRSRYFASSGTVMSQYKRPICAGKAYHYKTYEDDIQTIEREQ
jgi:hypothetical protein